MSSLVFQPPGTRPLGAQLCSVPLVQHMSLLFCAKMIVTRFFDDNSKFLEMWEEAREAASSRPSLKSSRPPTLLPEETDWEFPADGDSGSFDNVLEIPVDDRGDAFNKPFFQSR